MLSCQIAWGFERDDLFLNRAEWCLIIDREIFSFQLNLHRIRVSWNFPLRTDNRKLGTSVPDSAWVICGFNQEASHSLLLDIFHKTALLLLNESLSQWLRVNSIWDFDLLSAIPLTCFVRILIFFDLALHLASRKLERLKDFVPLWWLGLEFFTFSKEKSFVLGYVSVTKRV